MFFTGYYLAFFLLSIPLGVLGEEHGVKPCSLTAGDLEGFKSFGLRGGVPFTEDRRLVAGLLQLGRHLRGVFIDTAIEIGNSVLVAVLAGEDTCAAG